MKVVSCRSYKSLRPFNILTVWECSETVFFREWSKQVFDSLQFPNQSSYDDHFFFKMFKIWCRFQRWNKKKIDQAFAFKDNCIWIGTTNCHNPEQDCCHLESMCYETPLRFNISLREIFFKSGSLRVMKKYDESSVILILSKFGSL